MPQSSSSESSAAALQPSALYAYRETAIDVVASSYNVSRFSGIRIRIEATHPVFAYRMLLTDANTGAQEGFFDHVCSAADLAEYPIDGPQPGASPAWFRTDVVDVVVRAPEIAEDFIKVVNEDITQLRITIDTMENLTNPGFFGA